MRTTTRPPAESTAASAGGSIRDAESLFCSKPIPEIRAVEAATRREIEQKKEELRQLVGKSYRDLIDSADSIIQMKSSCISISANNSPLTSLNFLERTATVDGDRPSVVYNQTVYTWTQTHLRISPGQVVSVLAPNIPAMYEMHFGVPMSGAVLNTINIRLDARTVSILLRHSACQLLFVDPLSLPLAGLRCALQLRPPPHGLLQRRAGDPSMPRAEKW